VSIINELLDEVWASWDSLVEAYRVYFPEPKAKSKPKVKGGIVTGDFSRYTEPGLRKMWTDGKDDYPGKMLFRDMYEP